MIRFAIEFQGRLPVGVSGSFVSKITGLIPETDYTLQTLPIS